MGPYTVNKWTRFVFLLIFLISACDQRQSAPEGNHLPMPKGSEHPTQEKEPFATEEHGDKESPFSEDLLDGFKNKKTSIPTLYVAKKRPIDKFTLRLNFQNVCLRESNFCQEEFSLEEWHTIMDHADSVAISYGIFPTDQDNTPLYQIRKLEPNFPLIGKGYALPLIYEPHMRNPYELKKRLYHTPRTNAPLEDWAMQIKEKPGIPGTAVTPNQLVRPYLNSLRKKLPFNYPIRFFKFDEIFPNQRQFQQDRHCVNRDIEAPEGFSTAMDLGIHQEQPFIKPEMRIAYYANIAGGNYEVLVDSKPIHFIGIGERGYYQDHNTKRTLFEDIWGPFQDSDPKTNPPEVADFIAIQDAACFQIDPSKPKTAQVVVEALQRHIATLQSDGVITDNFGNDYESLVPQGERSWAAIPWFVDGRQLPYYLVQSSQSNRSSHFRPAFDNEPDPRASFEKAFLSFTRRSTALFHETAQKKKWMINLNSIRGKILNIPRLSDQLKFVSQTIGQLGFWDEKFNRTPVNSPANLKQTYLTLAAAHEASKQGVTAVLTSPFYNYNAIQHEDYETDNPNSPYGFRHILNVENAIARYLQVLENPSIQIHWSRRRGYIQSDPGNDLSENYYSSNVLLKKLVRYSTWIRFFSELEAGQALMKTAGITGLDGKPYQLMYRQFENALSLSNMTTETLAVQVPKRSCQNCNHSYTYFRMKHWRGAAYNDHNIVPPVSLKLTDKENGEFLAKLDRYQPGNIIYITPGASLVLYNAEALPFDELPGAIEQLDRKYLNTPVLRAVSINHNRPLQLELENYRHFLEVPPELDQVN
jgi:hypothetical protein